MTSAELKVKAQTIYYPLLVTTVGELLLTQTNPVPYYGSRCEPGTGEFLWIGVLRGVLLRTLTVISEGSLVWWRKCGDPCADSE